MVDHDVVDGAAGGGEAQAELSAQGFEDRWKVAGFGWERIGGRVGRKNGAEAEGEVVVAGEAGLVDDGAPVLLQDLREEPGEVDHRDTDAGDVGRGAVDGDLVVLRGGVGLELEAGGVDGEGVDVALADVVVKAQVEAVGQKTLVHDVEVVEGVWAVGAGLNVEAVGIDPPGAAFNLP